MLYTILFKRKDCDGNRWLFLTFMTLLVCLLVMAGGPSSFAQRSKKKNKNDNNPPAELTDKDNIKAEQLFTDGEKYYILEDYNKSLAFLQKALEIEPDNAAIHYKIAQVYEKSDDLDNALVHASQALKTDPDNKYYYLLVAEIYTKKSDFDNAAATYERLIDNIPGTEEYLFEMAALYIYQDKYDKALECYDRIEDKFGINDQVVFQKQNILLKQGKMEEVISEGKKLIDAYPDEPDYVVNLAGKLITNERFEEAEEMLQKARTDFPDNSMILYQLSNVYRKTGKEEEAKKIVSRIFDNPDFSLERKMQIVANYFGRQLSTDEKKYVLMLGDKIIENYPEEADAYALKGDILQSYDSAASARKMYLKSLNINPSNLQAWQNVLDFEMRRNDLDSVINHFERAVTYFPNQALLYFYGGSAYMYKNENKRAVTLLEQGKKLASSNTQLLTIINGQLGDAYNSLKAYDKSDEAYEAALDIDPDNDHVLNNYSYFLSLRKEKLDLALEMSTKLIDRNPDNATYLDTHAWVLFNLNRYKDALKVIEKAVSQDTNVSGTIIEHYGDILFKLGEVDKAVHQWEKAKELNVDSELIDKKIADRKLYE